MNERVKNAMSQIKWHKDPMGGIRASFDGHEFCPITWTAFDPASESGSHFELGEYVVAASTIGLSDKEAYNIATAADLTIKELQKLAKESWDYPEIVAEYDELIAIRKEMEAMIHS